MPTRSKLADVNVLAIFLVEDHPGHPYVDEVISEGLVGAYRLLVPDQAPLRMRWVLTNRWGIRKAEADQAVEDFLQHRRVSYVAATRAALKRTFELSRILHHDVYDTFYLALALDHSATSVVTTDTDFKDLCRKVKLEYENPVPEDVLSRFGSYTRR